MCIYIYYIIYIPACVPEAGAECGAISPPAFQRQARGAAVPSTNKKMRGGGAFNGCVGASAVAPGTEMVVVAVSVEAVAARGWSMAVVQCMASAVV